MWASVILVLARLAQGLAHGGELPSAQTYIAEAAPRERRGLWSSLIYFSGTIGQLAGTLLAAILSTVLTQDAMTAYGWRIPFVLGGVFGLYALYMRLRMHETEVFVDEVVHDDPPRRRAHRTKGGIWQTIKEHPKLLFQVIGLTMGATVLYYVWAISAPAYAINVLHVPAAGALWAGIAAQVVFLIVLPLWGIVSDRIGRKPVLLTAVARHGRAELPAERDAHDVAVVAVRRDVDRARLPRRRSRRSGPPSTPRSSRRGSGRSGSRCRTPSPSRSSAAPRRTCRPTSPART